MEVAFNGRWGTICEDAGWSVEDATVVCNQLGLDSDSSPTITSGRYMLWSIGYIWDCRS